MGQLIRATTIPFKAIHFTQQARLVSSDSVDIERRKAIARHVAMNTRFSSGAGTADYTYIRQINRAFVAKQTPVPQSSGNPAPVPQKTAGPKLTASVEHVASVSYVPSAPLEAAAQPVQNTVAVSEPQAAYTAQRGAFELRVAKGELAYLPPLEMTIITQYPDVEFEYLGGIQYVPPRDDDTGSNVNLSI